MVDSNTSKLLVDSRNKFFSEEKLKPGNFWLAWYNRVRPDERVTAEDLAELEGWVAHQSNCPELELALQDIAEMVPDRWRNFIDAIFVGRVFDGDINASTHTQRGARTVKISLQYTHVLSAYVAAWDEQMAGLRRVFQEVQNSNSDNTNSLEALNQDYSRQYWELLDDAGAAWRDRLQIAGLVERLRVTMTPNRDILRANAVIYAEQWILCHELAHQLLGHTTRHKREPVAAGATDTFRKTKLSPELNKSQREECDADLLAHLILAGYFKSNNSLDRHDLYRASVGAAMALVSLAHSTGHWTTERDPNATHPGFSTRWEIFSDTFDRLSDGLSTGEQGDHPRDLLIDLDMFATAALYAAAKRAGNAVGEPLTLVHIAGASLKRKRELREHLRDAAVGGKPQINP